MHWLTLKMREMTDWYLGRFRDNRVLFVMQRRKVIPLAVQNPWRFETEEPYRVSELAQFLKRSEKSIRKSFSRLSTRGRIEPWKDGWRIHRESGEVIHYASKRAD